MDPIITNTFPKQPRESIWVPISFAERLASNQDAPRAVNPIEFGVIPAGVTLLEDHFDPVTSRLSLLIGGGISGRKYLLTMWIHTTSGQRLQHQVTIKVKELTK